MQSVCERKRHHDALRQRGACIPQSVAHMAAVMFLSILSPKLRPLTPHLHSARRVVVLFCTLHEQSAAGMPASVQVTGKQSSSCLDAAR